jgi:hypothetical protein
LVCSTVCALGKVALLVVSPNRNERSREPFGSSSLIVVVVVGVEGEENDVEGAGEEEIGVDDDDL